ncbi:protein FAM205C [Phacochoerus africanus]|uniref:protein FAM205C n=1 Tax=Phacochoerus africanus TaxID=41426 RepID=UPI001FD996A4|nr:protein FAM205C [Phacochoerus africanus]
MLSPTFILWDVGYPFYTYGSILIIALIIWQVRKNHRDLRVGPNRSCCRRHRRVKQRAKDKTSRARRLSRKEAEKPWELLSVMRSQDWLPQEGSVRQLLCADPCCQICNDVALEIQQLILGESSLTTPTSSGPSHGSSCLDILSLSSLSFGQSQHSLHSKELSRPSATRTVSQLTTQKSLTQLAAKSTFKSATKSASAVTIHDYWADHQQLRQGFQGPDVPWDAGVLSSSSVEEPRIHRDKKSNTKCVPEKQEGAEAGLGDKTKHFPHWINPEVKGQGHKESVLLSKDEKMTETKTKNVEKSPPPTKRPVKGAKSDKTTEEEGMAFFDALQCLDNEFQQHSLQSNQSWFLHLSHNSSKHCPQLISATQPENTSHVSTVTSA